MRILVTGSRNWKDDYVIKHAMVDAVRGHAIGATPVLVHGGAKGADGLADITARELGWEVECHPALWRIHKENAGMVRNTEMVNADIDLVLVFFAPCTKSAHLYEDPHPSHGAQDCADKAERANLDIRYHYTGGLKP